MTISMTATPKRVWDNVHRLFSVVERFAEAPVASESDVRFISKIVTIKYFPIELTLFNRFSIFIISP